MARIQILTDEGVLIASFHVADARLSEHLPRQQAPLIVFSDAPAPATSSHEALRASFQRAVDDPGRWHVVAVYPARSSASGLMSDLKRRKPSRGVPDGVWDFRTKKLDDGRFGVLAKLLRRDAAS